LTIGRAAAQPIPAGLRGYAFGTLRNDVTVFDPASRRVLDTRPLGVTVRWLSNEQRYWDGRDIWTYDFPDNRVVVVAIDPRAVAVRTRVETGAAGPAHSVMLTNDRREAWVNAAGSNELLIIDRGSGRIDGRIATGQFP
jgi:DNA-binding beta-propeller fold protein YncE